MTGVYIALIFRVLAPKLTWELPKWEQRWNYSLNPDKYAHPGQIEQYTQPLQWQAKAHKYDVKYDHIVLVIYGLPLSM